MLTKAAICVMLLIGALVSVPVSAQPASQNQDPTTKPRKVKDEPKKAFKQWLVEVEPILTQAEKDAWPKLQTDEEREQFIDTIWHNRDPDPDTEENEFRDQYFERLAYVNEHFASGTPGYKTDRGRVYLRFGKPDDVESHPAGGPYQRESWEGGGSTSTYPFERWFYRNLPGRAGATVEFVDPTGTGEYRLARNPFEKEAMLTVSGTSTMNGRSQADVLQAANGWGNPFSSRAEDGPFDWMELRKILDSPPPAPKGNDPFATGVHTPRIEDNALDFEVSFGFFRLDDNRVITTVTVQTDNRDLSFQDSGGVQVASVNIFGRIINVVGRRVGFFEDVVSTTATPEELISAKQRKAAYQKTVVLSAGNYKADLLVRDTKSGATGFRQIGFKVPRFGVELSASSLILASVLQQTSDVSSQFRIGDNKVIPNLARSYHRGSPVGVYMQVYNATIDQTTLKPSVDVEYVLLKDGQEIGKQIEDWHGNSDMGQRLTLARLLDSRSLNPGEYSIEVRVRDHVSGQKLIQSAKFTIVP